MPKETYPNEKRPTYKEKELQARLLEIQNKDIHNGQKRPTHMKRDLHI